MDTGCANIVATMKNKWINIEERMPPQDTYVLVAYYDYRPKVKMHFIRIAKRFNTTWFDDHDEEELDIKYGYVTHWQLLPDKPTK